MFNVKDINVLMVQFVWDLRKWKLICKTCRKFGGADTSISNVSWKKELHINLKYMLPKVPVSWETLFSFHNFWSHLFRWNLFYRTRIRSLAMLVSNWLPNLLTDWLLFSKLYWCDPGMWRCLLKTCRGCYCCWCWWWESCWQQFVADLETEVSSKKLNFSSGFQHKVWLGV